jgi:predicted enzyme related to lactoylglutathione lyase
MAEVTGLGGVFLKTGDKEAFRTFFADLLGVPLETWGGVFPWRDREQPERKGYTVLGLHDTTSDYFDPSDLPVMLNLRVDDLDGMMERLRAAGHEVTEFPAEPNGRFAHLMGPGGLKLELWEPVENDPYDS